MKNDFINNMTHEFKTPISSISLAAQMLSDQSIKKSEAMYENLSRVINDETKRLRFQVEKVLQMSLYDRDNIAFKQKELDAHQLLAGVIKTLKRIFDKFYRVHTGNKHDVKGFGLGLAYVKKIVGLQNGVIHAESEYGHGTKFIITLPTIKK